MDELMVLFKNYDKLYYEWARDSGLSETAFYIIMAVWEKDGECTQAYISSEWSMSRQTVNSALKALEKDGYIKLEPEKTGRKKIVYMTLKGKKYAKEYVAPILKTDGETWGNIPKEKREMCVGVIKEYFQSFSDAVDELKK